MMNYQEDGGLRSLSLEQTHAAQHYNYNKAISSSLKILTFSKTFEEIGHGSGNYFKIGRDKFIFTAAHLVAQDSILYAQDGAMLVKLYVAHVDYNNDIAILVPANELRSVKSFSYILNDEADILGISTVYAGYPSDLNKAIFSGMVSRCSNDSFIMQSFALPGSSGSVVFDNSGRAMGILIAVKISISPFPQLHDTLVYVSRIRNYTRKNIKEILRQWKNLE
jgi:hypothetical protein